MSIRRITISVQKDVASRIKRAAGSAPVSSWVAAVIEERLDRSELERAWQSFYEEVNPGPSDRKRAAQAFKRITARSPRRRRAA